MYGDAWLARIFDNEDEFRRLDFTLEEVSSSAAWVRTAKAQSDAKARSSGPVSATMQQLQADAERSRQTAAAPASKEPPPPEEAARVRSAGRLGGRAVPPLHERCGRHHPTPWGIATFPCARSLHDHVAHCSTSGRGCDSIITMLLLYSKTEMRR